MKKILSKKDRGMLDQMLPLVIGIFILSVVFVLMLGTMESIQSKNKVDLIARRAILLVESYGYLEESQEQELLADLAEANIENAKIKTSGYQSSSQTWGEVSATNPASYGQKVEVKITGNTQIALFEKQTIPVQVVRVSTGKN